MASTVLLAAGQTPTATYQRFDVVSVKPCEPNAPSQSRGGGGSPITSPGRLYLQCYSLSSLIPQAYLSFADGHGNALWTVTSVGVEGVTDWMKTERYTIEATTGQAASPAMMRGPMLQAILQDRFKLKIRRVTRETPIYELVIAKSGAKVTPYTGHDCVIRDDAAWPPPALPAGQRYCGGTGRMDGDRVTSEGVMTLDMLASLFAFDRPVVNKTGITAPVSYRYEYQDSRENPAEVRQASVVAAIRTQLGLDIRPANGPRDFLVIDHAERPTPN